MKLKESIKADIEKNKKYIKNLGPGIITGGAGDDPAGIVTYILVGAKTGFSQLWLLLLSTFMMIGIQNLVARIALVTGKSLPELTNAFYSKKLTALLITILAFANILTIGADLNAVANILHLIFGYATSHFLILITTFIAYLIIFGKYKTVKKILIVLTTLLSVYIIAAILEKPSLILLSENTFIPHIVLKPDWFIAALGLLGTTISPYLLFWQTAEEKEEKHTVVQIKEVSLDTAVGMVYSNLLAYTMVITGALTLYGKNCSDLTTLAETLKPAVSDYAFTFFTLGLIVSGLLAIPVLASSTAYAVADTFGWREDMDYKVSDAKGFYFVFLGSLLIGDLINILPNITPVEALYYSQVLDGILLPIILFILLLIGNNREIMGEYRATLFQNIFTLFTLLVSLFLTVSTLWNWAFSLSQ